MKNIIFTILILIFILVVVKCNKENFTNGKKVDSQKLNILQSFIKSNTNDFCAKANNEGLFVIESEYFRDRNDGSNDKKYFMYIDNSNSKNIQDIFKFRNSNIDDAIAYVEPKLKTNPNIDKDMTDLDDFKKYETDGTTRRIASRKSNTRIDNGIWISIDDEDSDTISKKKDRFKFRKFMRYTDGNEEDCEPKYKDKKRFLCRHKDFVRDLEIVQVYDNKKKNEVRYMLKYQGKYLYVSEKDKDVDDKLDDIKDIDLFRKNLVLKQLDMDMICNKEGDYTVNTNNEFIKDEDTYEDNRFNRTYRDIPLDNMCPKEFPYACSLDYRYWRNVCTKEDNKDKQTGLCDEKDITNNKNMRISENNVPMRNFNCNGFRCLKSSSNNHPLNAEPNKEFTDGAGNKKYNYINREGVTSTPISYQEEDTTNGELNLVSLVMIIVKNLKII